MKIWIFGVSWLWIGHLCWWDFMFFHWFTDTHMILFFYSLVRVGSSIDAMGSHENQTVFFYRDNLTCTLNKVQLTAHMLPTHDWKILELTRTPSKIDDSWSVNECQVFKFFHVFLFTRCLGKIGNTTCYWISYDHLKIYKIQISLQSYGFSLKYLPNNLVFGFIFRTLPKNKQFRYT
jgi:hypothetical protein